MSLRGGFLITAFLFFAPAFSNTLSSALNSSMLTNKKKKNFNFFAFLVASHLYTHTHTHAHTHTHTHTHTHILFFAFLVASLLQYHCPPPPPPPPPTTRYKDMLKEIYIMSKLGHHPNVVGFFGVSMGPGGMPMILIELINGPTLDHFLASMEGMLPHWRRQRPTYVAWTKVPLCLRFS